MWSQERSEFSLAPTLGWLALAVIVGVFVLDGNLVAVTGRLTADRSAALAPGTVGLFATSAHSGAPAEPPAEPIDETGSTGDETEVAAAPASDPASAGAGKAPASPLSEPCRDSDATLCQQRALDTFRLALTKSRSGQLGRALRLSLFGDSVVATDEIPAQLRHRAIADLGDGGPGFIFAHEPHRFCLHNAIAQSHSGSWSSFAVSMNGVRDRWYGFGGSTAQTSDGTVTTRIKALPATRIAVHYLAQPRGGTMQVMGDRESTPLLDIDSRAPAAEAAVARAEVSAGVHTLALRTTGSVRLFGLVLERDRGAVVDNLGIVSVTAKNFVRNDGSHWASQIRLRQPDLVMVMMGANESTWLQGGSAEMRDYATRFAALLAPIRDAGAACLVISPLDQVEVREGSIVARKLASRLVEAQRSAATSAGCAFFDTLAWMGGPGSAVRWRRKNWLGGDYVHLTRKGSEKLGDALYQSLFAAEATAP
jgi:lysophospholipase L1-like esterase